MAKRKKGSKVQMRRGNSAKRGKARKVAKPATRKRTVASAKPKRAPAKKAARKVKQPVALEIQWRLASFKEAKAVVTQYHKYLSENSLIKTVVETDVSVAPDLS